MEPSAGPPGEIADRVAALDWVIRRSFGDDPEVMAEWHAAKRVGGGGVAPAA